MNTTIENAPPTCEVLDAVRALAPEIAARADEIEGSRCVPVDLLDRLKRAGCFRLLLPTTHGGTGGDLMTAMRVYEELARADASVSWVIALGASCWIDVVELPRSTFDAIYGARPDVLMAGVFNPTGVAVPVEGGYQVNGRWSFASGCEHSDWLYANCVDTSTGEPQMRMAVFSPTEIEIQDTWSVSGLRGTGSHHFVADDIFVPAERTFHAMVDDACIDVPLVRIPVPATFALQLASVAVGIAQGAFDDVVALAMNKVPLLSPSNLAINPLFQHHLGQAEVALRAARELLYAETAAAWATAVAGDDFIPNQRARMRSAGVFAASTAASVVDTAYTAGGGSSLYDTCPLQRRLRDVHALTQHFLLKLDTLTTCGAVLAGQEPDLTIF